MPYYKPKNEKMDKAERKAVKDWLKDKGLKQADLDLLPDDGEETREQMAVKLVKICQGLPKKM